jgi:hypothetical protein
MTEATIVVASSSQREPTHEYHTWIFLQCQLSSLCSRRVGQPECRTRWQ